MINDSSEKIVFFSFCEWFMIKKNMGVGEKVFWKVNIFVLFILTSNQSNIFVTYAKHSAVLYEILKILQGRQQSLN